MPPEYKIVVLPSGPSAIYSSAYDETMHPGLGPVAEAETLHVGQLRIQQRLVRHDGEFVVWDIGLGAAANALTLLRLTRDSTCPLRLVSFDNTTDPLDFAIRHAGTLGYPQGRESILKQLSSRLHVAFGDGNRTVDWNLVVSDFPSLLSSPLAATLNKPHAIMFDAFSPPRNPAMWTLSLFTNLFRSLDPARPCALTTYSRSTMIRVSLLLAGFFVGRGLATGLKEETTVAANTLDLLDAPLERSWLERARKSTSAEPLTDAAYRRAPLSAPSWERLTAHAQFQ